MYLALAAWIPNLAQKHSFFVNGRFPSSIQALRRERRVLQPVSCSNEILWSAILLKLHTERITRFCTLAREFDSNVLAGRYEDAQSSLDAVESAVGYSLWLIESRLALLQVWKGLEAQKAYATQVRDPASPFVDYFAYAVSERNEETTNPDRFRAAHREYTIRSKYDPANRSYLAYQIIDQIPRTAADIGSVLPDV